jgi:cell division septum initiation protein DivIVA
MNLQQTIEELETKAAEYTQAANSLRALLPYENVNGSSHTKLS